MILFINFALDNLGCNIHSDAGDFVLEFVHGLLLFLLDLRLCLFHQACSIGLCLQYDFVVMGLCLLVCRLGDVSSLCLCIGNALLVFVTQLFRSGLSCIRLSIGLVDLCLAGVQNVLYGLEKKVFEQQE